VEEMGLKDNSWATNGSEALTLLKRNPTDLIICGVSVPEMDALELLRACKEDPRLTQIPFIIMGSAKLLRAEALEAGMDVYIVNPVSPDELQEALKKIGACPFPHAPPEKE
jgi:CheY-like chemotaxis protein